MKRFFALFLSCTLFLTSLPLEALAAQMAEPTAPEVTEATVEIPVPVEFVLEETEIIPETTETATEPATEAATEATLPPTQPATEPTVAEETADSDPVPGSESAEGYTYRVLDDGTCEVTGFTGNEKVLNIPGSLDGYTVTSIGNSAFKGWVELEQVTLPQSVVKICHYAFMNCYALSDINFPKNLETIESSVFENCASLTELPFNAELTSIGQGAFRGCTGLTSVTIPSGVTLLDGYVFQGCSALTELNLPDGLKEIQGGAVWYCSSLEYIDIPDTVTIIGANAFANNPNLKEIGYPKGWTTVTNGYSPFQDCPSLTKIEIPEGVTVIPDIAFSNCALEEVVLPDSLTTIGNNAFYRCMALTDITIPDGVTTIGNNAFSSCTTLPEIVLPDSVTSIGYSAFASCSALEKLTLSNSLTKLDQNIFNGCTSLVSVTIPESVVTLSQTFPGCTALIEVNLPEGLKTIAGETFKGCTSLEKIDIPASVTTMGGDAFGNCTALKELGYPIGWTTSGTFSPFRGCTSLTKIEVPEGVTSIPAKAFMSFAELEEIILPQTLTFIGNYAFASTGLKEITIPDSVTNIEGNAFVSCKTLEKVTLSNSLTTLASSLFSECTALTSITIPASVKTIYSAFPNCTALAEVNFSEGLVTIGGSAFRGCTSLERVDIPASVTSIGTNAFGECTALKELGYPVGWTAAVEYNSPFKGCTSLAKIEVPEGVTVIPEMAFYQHADLQEITLPDSLTTIGRYAFGACTGLTEITIPGSVTKMSAAYIFSGCTGLQSVIIEEGVTYLGPWLFGSCSGITSVTLPSTLTTIENDVFDGCSSLAEIQLPEGLTTIGAQAFARCSALEKIHIPDSVTTLGGEAFYNCTSLSEVNYPIGWSSAVTVSPFVGCPLLTKMEVPEGVTAIPEMAFYKFKELQEITLPDSLTTIGRYSFGSCTGLTSIVIPKNVTNVGYYAFSGCTGLRHLTLQEGVAQISSWAFSHCGLGSLSIPDSVTTIQNDAFFDCTNLSEVRTGAGLKTIEAQTFYGCTNLKRVILDDALVTIGSEAFSGCTGLQEVSLSYNLKTIGGQAFANCPDIGRLIVPSSITSISSSAFSGWQNLVFCCSPSAYAASYALDNQIPLVTLTDEPAPENSYLDYEKSSFRLNYDKISNANGLHLITDYVFKEGITAASARSSTITNIRLSFLVPANAQVTNVKVDGKWVKPVPTPENGILTVPVTKTSERVHVYMLLPQNAEVNTYAKVTFNAGGGEITEIIGTLNTPAPTLTIFANSETANSKVNVTGSTIPGNTVRLFVDGKEQQTVKANQAGDFTATVSLGTIKAHQKYEIKATTVTADGLGLSDIVTVTGKEVVPEIVDFVIEHANQTLRLSETPSGKGNMIYYQNMPFKFTIYFNTDRPDISGVSVKTTNKAFTFKGVVYPGSYDSIMAKWDASVGAYVAEGKFRCSPGKFTVCYVGEKKQIEFTDTYDFTAQENYSTIPKIWHEPKITVNQNDGSTFEGVMESADGSSINFTSEKQAIPGGLTAGNAEAQGYMKVTDSNNHVVFLRKYENAGRYEIGIADFAAGEYMKFCLEEFTAAGQVINNIFDFISLIDETAVDTSEYALVKRDIQNSNLNSGMKQQALKKVETAQALDAAMTVGKWIGFACGVASIFVPGLGFAYAAMLATTGFIFDEVQDATELTINNMMYNLQEADPELVVCFAMDPSGYLYDAETEKRIAGATVTAYYIPYDESATFWDSPPAEDVYGTLWDASEWSQGNPMKTDAEGKYAWDVPQGWWRVKAEHPDYETAWSEWLPVPPPQTEVNLAMKCIRREVETDFNGDSKTTEEDAIYLLWHTLFEEMYPISIPGDLNGDNAVTDADAVKLLWYILFPAQYPL